MKYKINIIDIIIIWVSATLLTFVLLYFVFGQEQSILKSILAAVYWMAPLVLLSYLNKREIKELINYIKNNHPQDHEKYAYSNLWDEDRPGYKFLYYYLFKESESDEQLNEMKNQILYIFLFISFHMVFGMLIISFAYYGFRLYT